MTTTELARKLGLTYRKVDFWCRRGYVEGQEDGPGSGGHRQFTPEQVERVVMLAKASRLKQMSIADLADSMSDESIDCGHTWRDGWGEHRCHLLDGHDGPHRCECDFTDR